MSYLQGEYPIVEKRTLAKEIYDVTLHCPEIVKLAKPGQFVHIRVPGFTLRRPISICEIHPEQGNLRLVFEVRGAGTQALADIGSKQTMDIMGPLGNGFALLDSSQHAVVVGGGIGVPPMLETAKHYGNNVTAILGFRSMDACILEKDFSKLGGEVMVCTDDGSKGRKGFVTQALEELLQREKPGIIYACGPTPMLKAVGELAKAKGIRCQVSLEERMGCGVGACLVCACKIAAEKGETYKHVCKDGPVFEAEEVGFDG